MSARGARARSSPIFTGLLTWRTRVSTRVHSKTSLITNSELIRAVVFRVARKIQKKCSLPLACRPSWLACSTFGRDALPRVFNLTPKWGAVVRVARTRASVLVFAVAGRKLPNTKIFTRLDFFIESTACRVHPGSERGRNALERPIQTYRASLSFLTQLQATPGPSNRRNRPAFARAEHNRINMLIDHFGFRSMVPEVFSFVSPIPFGRCRSTWMSAARCAGAHPPLVPLQLTIQEGGRLFGA